AYRKAIALKPDYALAHANLGIVLADQGKLGEAVTAFRKAIGINPNYAKTHNNLGLVLADHGKLEEDVDPYRKTAKPLHNHPFIRNNLRRTERLLELDKRLPALLAGKAKPSSPQEQIELALFCSSYKERYRAAVLFFIDAFTAERKLAEDLNAQHRYNA